MSCHNTISLLLRHSSQSTTDTRMGNFSIHVQILVNTEAILAGGQGAAHYLPCQSTSRVGLHLQLVCIKIGLTKDTSIIILQKCLPDG